MRAAVLHGPQILAIEERPEPSPRPGWTTVRVRAVGLCGSDLHYYSDGRNGAIEVLEPFILGHEPCGTVVECSSGAWAPGTPVAIDPAIFADEPSDHPHLDAGGSYLGSARTVPHRNGALQELIQVPDDRIHPLPAGADPLGWVLAEPLAVALHAVRLASDHPRHSAMVCGAGPIGLLVAAALRDAGVDEVVVTDVKPPALALAEILGFVTAEAREVDPDAFDQVYECSGSRAGLGSALAAARVGGVVVQVGTLPSVLTEISLSPLMTKELTYLSSMRFADELPHAVRLLSEQQQLNAMVTSSFPLDRAADALKHASGSGSVGKTVVLVSREGL